ncbi:4-(cytidine 5'-diphospho)-2-C-methyl-D-erythritol kinase [Thorsellia kenyensis]|uniref:4-diphosphocytidyl-2-C-methyl-D-erythritol kinase n=1 Tax=Thorsellia kenyensis TaxID=1549888 RepID=A0ABV6CE14_9GAMM
MKLKIFSPAKLNLFLSITGRRSDGYHELETLFQLLNVGDEILFEYEESKVITEKPKIELFFSKKTHHHKFTRNITLHPKEDNLIIKAADLLYEFAVERNLKRKFTDISILLDKKMPLGAGLGAGSSNAASTLIALNQIWQLYLPVDILAKIAVNLGADVPIFIINRSAFATGVGDVITPVDLNERWYLLIFPNKSIPTQALFQSNLLKRDYPKKTWHEWLHSPYFNVFTPVASKLFNEVQEAIDWLTNYSEPFMSGTGSTVFAIFEDHEQALNIQKKVPSMWWSIVAKGVNSNQLLY